MEKCWIRIKEAIVKKLSKILLVSIPILVAAVLLTATGVVRGTGSRTGGVILQNIDPSGDVANIALNFYDQDGDVAATQPVTLAQFAAEGVNARNVSGLSDGFVGSVVIESDKRLGAVADDTDDTSVGMYNGFAEGATTFYLPAIYNYPDTPNGWTTEIWVQATESVPGGETADVIYMNRQGEEEGKTTVDLTTKATAKVDPSDTVPNGWAGGVVISSTYKVAAIARVTNGDITEMYSGFPNGDAVNYAPALYKNAGGWYSGIMVQNLGTTSTTVSIDFYDRDGNKSGTYTFPDAFVANGVQAVNTRNVPDATIDDGWAGTAVVKSNNDNPIISVIDVTNQASGLGNIYKGALESDASEEAYIAAQYQYSSVGSWTSGVIAMNIDAGNTNVEFSYYDRDTQALTTSEEKEVGQYIAFALNTVSIDDLLQGDATTWAGATKVTTDDGSRVVVVANVTGYNMGKTAMYSAFPK